MGAGQPGEPPPRPPAPHLNIEQVLTGIAARLVATVPARPALRRAWTRWWELEAPYESARVRVLIGCACRELGDAEGAEMEWQSACRTFEELGAIPDIERVAGLRPEPAAKAPGGLTERELEALALVAAGRSNREIATELVISEHTARRHLQTSPSWT